ncbi:MAG: hypothetical protein QM490_04090 [Candidatus Gracilibacteria bacterium]
MKKLIVSFILLILSVSITNGLDGSRVCETLYTTIDGAKYFSSIHCTEDISLAGVNADTSALRNISTRVVNDFIIANNYKIMGHINDGEICDDLNAVEEIQAFETIIYSNNDISYTTTTSSIETLTTEIEDLREEYNSIDLYNTVFEETKGIYSLSSLDFLRLETRNKYFDKQLEIKNSILSKQKEKLTSIYKLTESQKFIESFYNQVNKVCVAYYDEKWGETTEEERKTEIGNSEENDDENDELILKYKEEFNEKLGKKLDGMPRQTLEQLSVKLLDYAENSPIFKKFSDEQKELVKLKIAALKAVIDDRL